MNSTKKILYMFIFVLSLILMGCQESESNVPTSQNQAALESSVKSDKAKASADIAAKDRSASSEQKTSETVQAANAQSPVGGESEPSSTPVALSANDNNGVKIEVTKAVHDFGELAPDTFNTCKFTFRNAGTTLLKVVRVQSTCGCSVPKLDKLEYKPGETGEVEVRFHSPGYKGNTTKHLYIVSNDPENPRAELELRAKIVVMVEVSPEKVELKYDADNADIVPLTVKSLDNEAFSITGVASPNNAITADFDPEKKATEFVLYPKVNTELLSKSPVGSIQIDVDHPKAKSVLVQYSMKPRFFVSRPRIILQNAVEGAEETKEVLIRSNYGEKIEIDSVTSRNGNMEITEQTPVEGDALKLMVKIKVPVQEDNKRRYFSDELKVKLTDGYETTIRCSGWYKRR